MIVTYLPTNKTIVSKNGEFKIKEVDTGYELWNLKTNQLLLTRNNINDFRQTIGGSIKIVR